VVKEQLPETDRRVLWRIRQFEYTWLRMTAGRYADFKKVIEDALNFSAHALKLELTDEKRYSLIGQFFDLRPWAEVRPVLSALKAADQRLAFLSNLTPAMLDGSIKASGLEEFFEHVISTDKAQTYKPSPAAYQLGVNALSLPKEQILFAAFAA
jgi:2-haloacid dehalogenase